MFEDVRTTRRTRPEKKTLSIYEYIQAIEENLRFIEYRAIQIGYDVNSINNMELPDLVKVINWDYIQRVSEKIDFFSAHGIDVKDIKKMGTDFYINFLDKHRPKKVMEDQRIKISKDEATKIKNFFQKEVDRVVMRRKIDGSG